MYLLMFDILDSVKQDLFKYISDCQFIHHLLNLNWVVVGKVKHLYAYPLISGNKYDVDECEINFDGMHMIKNNEKMKSDRLVQILDNYFLNFFFLITRGIISNVRNIFDKFSI